jgi:hypothetical protein
MAHVTVAEVQGWLDKDREPIPENDPLDDDVQFSTLVFAKIQQVMNTAGWIDVSTTPPVIRKIIACLVAANRYNRIYAEEEDAGNKYAGKLERLAWGWIQDIIDGKMVVLDNSGVEILNANDPRFYPTDATGAATIYDALGNKIGEPGSEDIKFTMAATF